MKIKIKQRTYRGRTLISPITNKTLFLHCSGGQKEVTLKRFNSHVEELLSLHGVEIIIITEYKEER